MRSLRFVGFTAVIALAAVSLPAASAATAAASSSSTTTSLSKSTVVLNASSNSHITIAVHFHRCVADPQIYIKATLSKDHATALLNGEMTTAKHRFAFNEYSQYGKWRITASGLTCNGQKFVHAKNIRTFHVKRRTHMARYNAHPEPIKRGHKLTVEGYLRRLNPKSSSSTDYSPYAHKKVRIYFRYPKRTYMHYKGSATTTKSGHFSKRFRDTHSGTWYAKFPATGYHNDCISRGDYVKVHG